MDKLLCFVLNDNRLFLDKSLVLFNNTPIFFVCTDLGGKYYLVLCIDTSELKYIVVETSIRTLWQMLSQKITMRNALLSGTAFWSVEAGSSPEDDMVELKDISEIDCDILPSEDAYYQKISNDDAIYIDKIKTEYFDEVNFDPVEEFTGEPTENFQVSGLENGEENVVTSYYCDFEPVVKCAIQRVQQSSFDSQNAFDTITIPEEPYAGETVKFRIDNMQEDFVQLCDIVNIAA